MADGEVTHVGGSLFEPGAIGVQSLNARSNNCNRIAGDNSSARIGSIGCKILPYE